MRLFIAIPMPEKVGDELSRLQQPIGGVRWEQKDKYHLTLKFLGNTESHKLEELQSTLDAINCSAFSMTMEGVGYFPRGGSPRVLWAGIHKDQPLQELQQTVEDLCTDLDFEPEQRSFKPHVTIGRVKDTPKNVITSFVEQNQDFRIDDIPVNKVVLYESKLHPDGARHIPKKEVSFRAR